MVESNKYVQKMDNYVKKYVESIEKDDNKTMLKCIKILSTKYSQEESWKFITKSLHYCNKRNYCDGVKRIKLYLIYMKYFNYYGNFKHNNILEIIKGHDGVNNKLLKVYNYSNKLLNTINKMKIEIRNTINMINISFDKKTFMKIEYSDSNLKKKTCITELQNTVDKIYKTQLVALYDGSSNGLNFIGKLELFMNTKNKQSQLINVTEMVNRLRTIYSRFGGYFLSKNSIVIINLSDFMMMKYDEKILYFKNCCLQILTVFNNFIRYLGIYLQKLTEANKLFDYERKDHLFVNEFKKEEKTEQYLIENKETRIIIYSGPYLKCKMPNPSTNSENIIPNGNNG